MFREWLSTSVSRNCTMKRWGRKFMGIIGLVCSTERSLIGMANINFTPCTKTKLGMRLHSIRTCNNSSTRRTLHIRNSPKKLFTILVRMFPGILWIKEFYRRCVIFINWSGSYNLKCYRKFRLVVQRSKLLWPAGKTKYSFGFKERCRQKTKVWNKSSAECNKFQKK